MLILHDDPRQAALYGYLAGILDGEGTLRINKMKPNPKFHIAHTRYTAGMSVGMVDKEPIDLLAKHLGGSVCIERAPSEGRRPIYRWAVSGRKSVFRALCLVLPYLRVKRPQAEILLDFILNYVDMRHQPKEVRRRELLRREELYHKMRELNAVGAAATTERDGIREDEATA